MLTVVNRPLLNEIFIKDIDNNEVYLTQRKNYTTQRNHRYI